jgi:hypothetical protein
MQPPGTNPETGRFEGGGSVTFGFLEDVTTNEFKNMPSGIDYNFGQLRNVPWYAELTLKVKDVAVLLKSGLFWSEDNIDSTKTFSSDEFIATQPDSEWIHARFRHGLFYELIDTEPAQWHGTLAVRAHAISTLHQFRPSQLSLANVRYVSAKDSHGRIVYYFDSADSGRCFNAMLGNTPLKGWWPWPKKEDVDDASTQEDIEASAQGKMDL